MIVLNILALNLFYVVYSVSSDDTENLHKASYKFNHPPQSESYQSIPVAIFYDEPANTNQKFLERVATTYHPRFKALETVTEQNRYEDSSSTINNDDFFENDERRLKRLRKARLRLRSDKLPNDATESATTLRYDPENTVTAKEFQRTEKYNTVYKDIKRSEQRGQNMVTAHLKYDLSAEKILTTERAKIKQSDTEQEARFTTLEETSATVKEVERTDSEQTISQGKQRGQRVTTRVQTDAPSSGVIDKATSSPIKIEQTGTDRKQTRGRGNARHRNYEQPSVVTTNAKISSTSKYEEENYPKETQKNKSRANVDMTIEQSVSPPKRENYPSSEQPKLTNNQPGPKSAKPRVQNNVPTNEAPQGGRQRVSYYSQSSVNAVEKDYVTKPSLTLELQNYPSTLRPRSSEMTTQPPVETTEEENYPRVPILPLQLKTNERVTTAQPIAITEEENYPKLPIVSLQQQLKTNDRTTILPLSTTEEENYVKQQMVSKTSDRINLFAVSTTERTKYSATLKPKTNQAVTIQSIVTTEEENYPKTVKPWSQYKEDVSNVQLRPTTQYISPSTLKPHAPYQQGEQENTKGQNDKPVTRDVDGTLITLQSSFDVATLTPLAKSVLQNNNKAKVIYMVQKTETPDVTYESTTPPTTTAEAIETTEKLVINENQIKPQRQQKNRNRFQNKNEVQIPVVIVYDNSDQSVPVNKRKILRTKFNPINNDEIVKPDQTVKPVHEVQTPPKTGNVTQNVNAERRTRGRKPVVPILESENHVYAQTGSFNYRYESGDGTNVFQEGILKPLDDDVTGEAVKGGFSYTDKDGNDFSLTYTADENGYRPVGAHLPTPPPIPPAIARALAYLATKSSPNPDEVTESSLVDV